MTEDQRRITMDERQELQNRDDQIVAAIDKDAFRAMFYLFAGKPDSKHQAFQGKVAISPNDIVELNDAVQEKFRHHSITQVITTVSLSLDKNKSLDFGTWLEFISQDWRNPEAVRDLTVKWDFLIRLGAFAQPQRHTLTVNFSGGMNPAAMLRIVADAVDAPVDLEVSKMFGGCMARVDFISHSLADELLALVGRWHAALPKAPVSGTLLEKCERNDEIIANIVNRSIPITAAIVAFFALQYVARMYDATATVTISALRNFCSWILGTIVLLWGSSQLGGFLAKRTYRAITNYGAHHFFRFTRGDSQKVAELEARNKKSAVRFCFTLGHAVVLHVIAGLIVFWLVGKH